VKLSLYLNAHTLPTRKRTVSMKTTVFMIAGWVCVVIGIVGGFAQSNLPAGIGWTASGLLILGYVRKKRRANPGEVN
jgi:hypothetical protein